MPVICIDGINGSGKTTQVQLLAERLPGEFPGARPVVLSDPGVRSNHSAEQLRIAARMGEWKHGLTRALCFLAARAELVAEIDDLLEDPEIWIILDRYIPSFCAYQLNDFLGACQGDIGSAVNMINMLHSLIQAQPPDLTFILDIDPLVGVERYMVSHDKLDVFECSAASTYSLYYRYQQLIVSWRSYRGLGDMCVVEVGNLSAKAVHENIWSLLCQHLQKEDESNGQD